MDQSFTERVDKIFGSLSSSSSSSTPWSLTDAQVERRVWNRDKGDDRDDSRDDDQIPVSSSFDNLFNRQRNRRKGLQDLSGDDHQIGGAAGDEVSDDSEWDIRSSIGLDSTLDNEEEEDAYDKMAEGRENAGDRLYMKDVTDHGPYLNSHNVLPNSAEDVIKDPRANHDAAKTRLIEDDVVGEKPGSSQTSDEPMSNAEEPCVTVTVSQDGTRIKSILKRKSDAVAKSAKRVRFDSTCKDHSEEANTFLMQGFALPEAPEVNKDTLTDQSIMHQFDGEQDDSVLSENGRGGSVPDYVLNPSKYTRYSLDDSSRDVNEGPNNQACLDFLEHVKNSKHVGLEQKADLPKSVIFIPRNKRGDGEPVCSSEGRLKQSSTQAVSGVSIAAEEVQQGGEICAMQEDETHEDAVSSMAISQKPGRRYRTKLEAEDSVG